MEIIIYGEKIDLKNVDYIKIRKINWVLPDYLVRIWVNQEEREFMILNEDKDILMGILQVINEDKKFVTMNKDCIVNLERLKQATPSVKGVYPKYCLSVMTFDGLCGKTKPSNNLDEVMEQYSAYLAGKREGCLEELRLEHDNLDDRQL